MITDPTLKADIAKIMADWNALTHEDLEEMYAREGYGCKCCDEPTSPSWWRGGYDIYCLNCKKAMRGLCKFTQVAHRAVARIERDEIRDARQEAKAEVLTEVEGLINQVIEEMPPLSREINALLILSQRIKSAI